MSKIERKLNIAFTKSEDRFIGIKADGTELPSDIFRNVGNKDSEINYMRRMIATNKDLDLIIYKRKIRWNRGTFLDIIPASITVRKAELGFGYYYFVRDLSDFKIYKVPLGYVAFAYTAYQNKTGKGDWLNSVSFKKGSYTIDPYREKGDDPTKEVHRFYKECIFIKRFRHHGPIR